METKPILFSGPMVRAILEGRKTHTRRVVSPYALKLISLSAQIGEMAELGELNQDIKMLQSFCPYGVPGDRLWVRETWRTFKNNDHMKPSLLPSTLAGFGIEYLADRYLWVEDNKGKFPQAKTRPSIFMPRWASRIDLEVVGVRVERLQSISEKDAVAEGLTCITKDFGQTRKYGIPDSDGLPGNDDFGWCWQNWETNPINAYRKLWESINGPGSWDKNPWVWVIEFKRVNA